MLRMNTSQIQKPSKDRSDLDSISAAEELTDGRVLKATIGMSGMNQPTNLPPATGAEVAKEMRKGPRRGSGGPSCSNLYG